MTAKLQCEWDSNKAVKNVEKHQVSFEEGATVFDDPMFVTFIGEEYSVDEEMSLLRTPRVLTYTEGNTRLSIMARM